MKNKSAPYQKALRDRRKAEGLKTLTRYVKPEWVEPIDNLIKELDTKHKHEFDNKHEVLISQDKMMYLAS